MDLMPKVNQSKKSMGGNKSTPRSGAAKGKGDSKKRVRAKKAGKPVRR